MRPPGGLFRKSPSLPARRSFPLADYGGRPGRGRGRVRPRRLPPRHSAGCCTGRRKRPRRVGPPVRGSGGRRERRGVRLRVRRHGNRDERPSARGSRLRSAKVRMRIQARAVATHAQPKGRQACGYCIGRVLIDGTALLAQSLYEITRRRLARRARTLARCIQGESQDVTTVLEQQAFASLPLHYAAGGGVRLPEEQYASAQSEPSLFLPGRSVLVEECESSRVGLHHSRVAVQP